MADRSQYQQPAKPDADDTKTRFKEKVKLLLHGRDNDIFDMCYVVDTLATIVAKTLGREPPSELLYEPDETDSSFTIAMEVRPDMARLALDRASAPDASLTLAVFDMKALCECMWRLAYIRGIEASVVESGRMFAVRVRIDSAGGDRAKFKVFDRSETAAKRMQSMSLRPAEIELASAIVCLGNNMDMLQRPTEWSITHTEDEITLHGYNIDKVNVLWLNHILARHGAAMKDIVLGTHVRRQKPCVTFAIDRACLCGPTQDAAALDPQPKRARRE
jgi:hypothetical protein